MFGADACAAFVMRLNFERVGRGEAAVLEGKRGAAKRGGAKGKERRSESRIRIHERHRNGNGTMKEPTKRVHTMGHTTDHRKHYPL